LPNFAINHFSPKLFERGAPGAGMNVGSGPATDAQRPIVYELEQFGSVAEFEQSEQFGVFRSQFEAQIEHIIHFAESAKGVSDADKSSVRRVFTDLKNKLFYTYRGFTNFFSDHKNILYGAGKASIDNFAQHLCQDHPRLSQEQLAAAVVELAVGLDVCAPGAASKLANAARDLELTTSGGLAMKLHQMKEALIQQTIIEFVRDVHRTEPHALGGDQIHYVNAYSNALSERYGLQYQDDPYTQSGMTSTVTEHLVEECSDEISRRLTVGKLVGALSYQCLDRWVEHIQQPSSAALAPLLEQGMPEDDFYSQHGKISEFQEVLKKDFGDVSINSCFQIKPGSEDTYVLAKNPTLIAMDLIKSLKSNAYIEQQLPLRLVLAWRDENRLDRQIIRLDGLIWTQNASKVSDEADVSRELLKLGDLNSSIIQHIDPNERLFVVEQALKNSAPADVDAFIANNKGWLASVRMPVYEDGETPISIAVQNGDLAWVKVLLAGQARASLTQNLGEAPSLGGIRDQRPLHLAAQLGNVEMVRALLDAHMPRDPINGIGFTPLMYAVQEGNAEIVLLLLSCGADPNVPEVAQNSEASIDTPLLLAVQRNYTEIAAALLRRGARTDIEYTYAGKVADIARENACRQMQLLIRFSEMIGDVNSTRNSDSQPLIAACVSGDVAEVEALLMLGADVNIKDINGRTPLHLACVNNRPRVAEQLIKAGASIEERTFKGRTPLFEAVVAGNELCLDVLVKAGADVNARDGRRKTPLIVAVRTGRLDYLSYLLRAGADPTLRDNLGRTPMIWAQNPLKRNKYALATLKEAGTRYIK
jgi:ankyrin repeat protein